MDLTNFGMGKSQKAVKPEKEIEEEEPKFEKVDDKNGWTDYNHQEVLNDKEHGYNYVYLQLFSSSDLTGIKYSVHISSTHQMPRDMMGSSWGTDNDFNLDKPQEFFDKRMKHKLEEQKIPYKEIKEEMWEVEHYKSSDFYRMIPMKNYIVIIGKKLKEMLLQKGFDFEAWYERYRAIEENLATEDYDDNVLAAGVLLKKGMQLIENAKIIKSSIRFKLGMKKRYGENVIDIFPEKTIDELMAKLGQIHAEAKKINQELWDNYYKDIQYNKEVIRGINEILNVGE